MKYNNVKTEVDGIRFDSKKEAKRYTELKLLEKAHKIARLKIQPSFKLQVQGVPICFDNGRQAVYRADFQYLDLEKNSTTLRIEDVKGMKTPVYKLKKAIMRAMGYEITEI